MKEKLDDIDFEPAPIPKSAQKLSRLGFKPIRGLWTVDIRRHSSKPREFFSKITSVVVISLKKSVDLLKHMRYSTKQTNKRKEIANMSNKTTKDTEEKLVKNKEIKAPFSWKKLGNGIIGVGQLFVAGSITASTVIIWNGTEGIFPKVIVAPMALYAVYILVSKFVSNNKGNK